MINFTKEEIILLKKLDIYIEIKSILQKIQKNQLEKEEGLKTCRAKILEAYQKSQKKSQEPAKIWVNTFPIIENSNFSSVIEHEATTSSLSKEQLFYLETRGLNPETAANLVINGFVKEVMQNLPMEFAIEAQNLLKLKLEGSVG